MKKAKLGNVYSKIINKGDRNVSTKNVSNKPGKCKRDIHGIISGLKISGESFLVKVSSWDGNEYVNRTFDCDKKSQIAGNISNRIDLENSLGLRVRIISHDRNVKYDKILAIIKREETTQK